MWALVSDLLLSWDLPPNCMTLFFLLLSGDGNRIHFTCDWGSKRDTCSSLNAKLSQCAGHDFFLLVLLTVLFLGSRGGGQSCLSCPFLGSRGTPPVGSCVAVPSTRNPFVDFLSYVSNSRCSWQPLPHPRQPSLGGLLRLMQF